MTLAEIILSGAVVVLIFFVIRLNRKISKVDQQIVSTQSRWKTNFEKFKSQLGIKLGTFEEDYGKFTKGIEEKIERDLKFRRTWRDTRGREIDDIFETLEGMDATQVVHEKTMQTHHNRMQQIEGSWTIFHPIYLKIVSLLEQGIGQRKIANNMGISRHRISAIAKNLKEQKRAAGEADLPESEDEEDLTPAEEENHELS